MPDTTRIGVDPRYKKMYIPRKYYIPGSPSPANPFLLVKPTNKPSNLVTLKSREKGSGFLMIFG